MTTRKKPVAPSAAPAASETATPTTEVPKTPVDIALENLLAAVADLPASTVQVVSGDYRVVLSADSTLLAVQRR